MIYARSVESSDIKSIVIHFHFTPQFNLIAANSILKSFKDSSYKRYVSKGVELIDKLYCRDVATFSETVFSNDLQNVWYNTIIEIRHAFGLRTEFNDPTIRTTVDEVVDNRNAIAHGRTSPVIIGANQNSGILRRKFTVIQNFNDLLIDEFEDYYNRKLFIKPPVRRLY